MAKRANILKLATKISLESLTYTGITYNDSEYKILEPIVDDDMCHVMMHMRLETPRTVEEIARRAKKDVAHTQEQIDKLAVAGIVRPKTVDGVTSYYYPSGFPASWKAYSATTSSVKSILFWVNALKNTPARG